MINITLYKNHQGKLARYSITGQSADKDINSNLAILTQFSLQVMQLIDHKSLSCNIDRNHMDVVILAPDKIYKILLVLEGNLRALEKRDANKGNIKINEAFTY